MDATALLWMLIVGLVAGFLAGMATRGRGFGFFSNVIIGIVGALIGGYLFGSLGVSFGGGTLGSILSAALGAIILLFFLRLLQRV